MRLEMGGVGRGGVMIQIQTIAFGTLEVWMVSNEASDRSFL